MSRSEMVADGQERDDTPTADCNDCPHRNDILSAGRCEPGDTCVRAMSGRQIERFFRENPALADDYHGDPFWERRAIAARYLSQQRLLEMLGDPDEVVRRVLARRLPLMQFDNEEGVRLIVVERMNEEQAIALLDDEDWRIRLMAVQKVSLVEVTRMLDDADEEVRAAARERFEASGSAVPPDVR